jgi:NADH:ubiquinone oxidoreductase subunit E
MKTVKVAICVGTHCTMMGAMDIYESITEMKEEYQQQHIEVELVKCFGVCKSNDAPVVLVGDRRITSATSEKVMETIMEVWKA